MLLILLLTENVVIFVLYLFDLLTTVVLKLFSEFDTECCFCLEVRGIV